MLYRVTKAGWLTDGRGAGAHHEIGAVIEMNETQAAYLLRSGQIAADTPAPTPARRKAKSAEA